LHGAIVALCAWRRLPRVGGEGTGAAQQRAEGFHRDVESGEVPVARAADLPWGVVTNKSKRFAEPLTQAMPLFKTAAVVISGDTTPYAKPHPEPLFEAARRLGIAPSACVYVGDDERDIVAGLAAGMKTVAATYGYLGTQSDVQKWQAHAHIQSPFELDDLLSS
jgi:phosphoglycolate phosphatase